MNSATVPPDDERPRFQAPWEARIFATVVSLADAGCFRWEEFQQRLSAELGRGDGDPGHYYEHWLAATEAVLADKGLLASRDLVGRIASLQVARKPTGSATP